MSCHPSAPPEEVLYNFSHISSQASSQPMPPNYVPNEQVILDQVGPHGAPLEGLDQGLNSPPPFAVLNDRLTADKYFGEYRELVLELLPGHSKRPQESANAHEHAAAGPHLSSSSPSHGPSHAALISSMTQVAAGLATGLAQSFAPPPRPLIDLSSHHHYGIYNRDAAETKESKTDKKSNQAKEDTDHAKRSPVMAFVAAGVHLFIDYTGGQTLQQYQSLRHKHARLLYLSAQLCGTAVLDSNHGHSGYTDKPCPRFGPCPVYKPLLDDHNRILYCTTSTSHASQIMRRRVKDLRVRLYCLTGLGVSTLCCAIGYYLGWRRTKHSGYGLGLASLGVLLFRLGYRP